MPTIDEVIAQEKNKTQKKLIQLDFIDNALTVLEKFDEGQGSFYDDYVVNALYTNLFDKLQDETLHQNPKPPKNPKQCVISSHPAISLIVNVI